MNENGEIFLWLPKDFLLGEMPEWKKYWSEVAPKLDAHLEKCRNPLVERYLLSSFSIYCWITEGFGGKITKHHDLWPKLSLFLIETQDLMRGIIACQRHMTLAPLGLILRTVFEIHCSFRFIARSNDFQRLADLYDRFQDVEQLIGRKSSPVVTDPTEEDYQCVRAKCPEWFKPGTNVILKDPHWTAIPGMSLRKMAEDSRVNLLDDYLRLYKTQSKFTHASPLLRNLYHKNGGLSFIPDSKQSNDHALLGCFTCMSFLEEACGFFGVKFPKYDYCLVAQDAMEAMGKPRINPAEFKN